MNDQDRDWLALELMTDGAVETWVAGNRKDVVRTLATMPIDVRVWLTAEVSRRLPDDDDRLMLCRLARTHAQGVWD